MIYGYVRVCSESDFNGKESKVQLFEGRRQRDEMMWEDYSDSFDALKENDVIGETDYNNNPKKMKEEFMKELLESKDADHDVFGLIQADDFHIQFEPFTKTF